MKQNKENRTYVIIRIHEHNNKNTLYVSDYFTYHEVELSRVLYTPHKVYVMCFVHVSEQIAIISLYSLKLLVFITDHEIVCCAMQATE